MYPDLYPFKVVTNIPAASLTVLRVPVATPLSEHPYFLDLDFAIQFDADRDQRVFPAVRTLWYTGLLSAQVCFVGEHRGTLTLAVDLERNFAGNSEAELPHGSLAAFEAHANSVAQEWADPWPVKVVPLAGRNLELARLLKLGTFGSSDANLADYKLPVPPSGWFALEAGR